MSRQTRTRRDIVGHRLGVVLGAVLLAGLGQATASPASAQELLTNGDLEAGTFAGWTVADLGTGMFSIDAPGSTTPLSGFTTSANAAGGSFYAVSDQSGPGTHALTQTFTVPGPGTVVLTFDSFVNDQSGVGPIVDPIGLDHTGPPNQHARVDILTAAAGPFDTGGGVLTNLYLGVDPGPLPNPYTSYMFDISGTVGAGGTFQVRFAEVDNQGNFHIGVDNVSIQFTAAAPTLSQWALAALAILLLLAGVGSLVLRERSGGGRAAG